MCLNTVEKWRDDKASGTGWKTFRIDCFGGLCSPYQTGSVILQPYNYSRWIKDCNESMIEAKNGFLYESGFHIFLTRKGLRDYKRCQSSRKDGEKYVVRKVKWKGQLAIGTQSDLDEKMKAVPCVVAKQMLILPDKVR